MDLAELKDCYLNYGGLLRAARRHADLSQRDLARRSKVSPSVISRVEAGKATLMAITLEKLLKVMGYQLQAVGPDGSVIDLETSWDDADEPRDGARRRFPAHLDVRHPTPRRPWWYDLHTTWGVKCPLLTFDLTRSRRDGWRHADGRGPTNPDERLQYRGRQSQVVIPGYRPKPRYG